MSTRILPMRFYNESFTKKCVTSGRCWGNPSYDNNHLPLCDAFFCRTFVVKSHR